MDLSAVLKMVTHVAGETNSEMQLHTFQTLLLIAEAGDSGIQQAHLEEKLGLNGGSTSRNVAYWTKRRADKKPGFDMVDHIEDDMDRRIRILKLNERGKRFCEVLKMF